MPRRRASRFRLDSDRDGQFDALRLATRGGGERDERPLRDDRLRAGITHEEGDLGCGEAEVHRHGDGTEGVGREHDLDVLRTVEHEDDDAVAEADAATRECIGELLDTRIQLRPGDGLAAESEGRAIGNHQGVARHLIVPVVAAEAGGVGADRFGNDRGGNHR